MPPKHRGLWTAGLLLAAVSLLGARLGSLTEPAGDIWLNLKLNRPRERPPVRFSHARHEAGRIGCEQCHHDFQGGRNLWRRGVPVKKCQACHGPRVQDRRLDIKNAFHRQCKGCHLKLRLARRTAGPVQCRDCHRRI
jgi:hypothetical protein